MNRLTAIRIQGFRPFHDFQATLGPLEVIVGANGTGKTALFEFLRFVRDSLRHAIPPEIIAGATYQQVFYRPGPDEMAWTLAFDMGLAVPIEYSGRLQGPAGQVVVTDERVAGGNGHAEPYLERTAAVLRFRREATDGPHLVSHEIEPTHLYLGSTSGLGALPLRRLARHVSDWRFFSTTTLDLAAIRRPTLIEPTPTLEEDARNLNAVLYDLKLNHPAAFDELQHDLAGMIPKFQRLDVRPYGLPNHVLGFWTERRSHRELTLADLSDGTLQVLCWATLGVHPRLPSLIGLDEPEQGLHPRTLALLAGIIESASQRSQWLVTTHDSYFLTFFQPEQIGVLRSSPAGTVYFKPSESPTITGILHDLGHHEIEILHRSDELEILP